MKKYVQKMWRIHDVLFLEKERAKEVEDGKEIIKEVFVGIDNDADYDLTQVNTEFFGRWVFNNEEEARMEVEEFNNN